MMNRLLSRTALAGLLLCSADAALACPMCKAAAEADPKLPAAFMASILFMLAMPFTIATCFGIAFYRLSKKAERQLDEPADSQAEPLQ